MLANDRDRLIAVCHALRNLEVLDAGQRLFKREHLTPRPIDETGPHSSYQDQRRMIEVELGAFNLAGLPIKVQIELAGNLCRHAAKNPSVGGK